MNVLGPAAEARSCQGQAPHLCSIPHGATREEAEGRRDAFIAWCQERGYQTAAETLVRDSDRMVAFYSIRRPTGPPQDHQPAGVALRRPEDQNRCSEALQATGQGHGTHLEAPDGGRETVSQAQRQGTPPEIYHRRFRTQTIEHQWSCRRPPPESIYTLLDRTSQASSEDVTYGAPYA